MEPVVALQPNNQRANANNVPARNVIFAQNQFNNQAVNGDVFRPAGNVQPPRRREEEGGIISAFFREIKKNWKDIVGDLVSGIVAFAAYTIAAAALAAAPLTGGSSLLITCGALAIAGLVGGVTKVAFKSICASASGEKYNSFGYDFATGAFSGILAPLTSACGSLVARFFARKAGIQALSLAVGKTMTTEIELVGGRFISRFGIRAAQMATDGAIAGSCDNTFRHVCQTGSLEGAGDAFVGGLVGGMVLSPAIGGGLRGIGRLAKKIKNVDENVRHAIEQGKIDMKKIPPPDTSSGQAGKIQHMLTEATQNPTGEMMSAAMNRRLRRRMEQLRKHNRPEINDLTRTRKFREANAQDKAKLVAERSITLGKLAQIYADDVRVPEHLRSQFKGFKSNNAPTRSLKQTQRVVDKIYGENKYEIIKLLGVGTVGEAYLAKTIDGRTVVVKLLKRGATASKLKKERLYFRELIRHKVQDPVERQYLLDLTDSYYRGWIKELNFANEAHYAVNLARGAKRFKVAQPIELGYRPGSTASQRKAISLVLECAEGVQLDKLMKMLEVYRVNKAKFAQEFAEEIRLNPWLKDPEQWMSQLPEVYLRAQNEQTLFSRMLGQKFAHGDPHAGNVFISNSSGRLSLTYIDTGLALERNAREVARGLGLSVHFLTGNSKGITQIILRDARRLPQGMSRYKVAKLFAQDLDNELFKKGISLVDGNIINNMLNTLLEKYGIILSPSTSIYFKSQLQYYLHYLELCRLTNQVNKNILRESFGDITRGMVNASRNAPAESMRYIIIPTIAHFLKDPYLAIKTITQFFAKG
jgi:predicted unusual protein kinase regulating ubiquinone biosynthesis (AarF/ABC1/UbiB family)